MSCTLGFDKLSDSLLLKWWLFVSSDCSGLWFRCPAVLLVLGTHFFLSVGFFVFSGTLLLLSCMFPIPLLFWLQRIVWPQDKKLRSKVVISLQETPPRLLLTQYENQSNSLYWRQTFLSMHICTMPLISIDYYYIGNRPLTKSIYSSLREAP